MRCAVEDARVVVSRRLFLDRWGGGVSAAAVRVAKRLGADRDRVCGLLAAEVRRQVERLQTELAA